MSDFSRKLTVAIPTYERPEGLKYTCDILLEKIHDYDAEIIIYDNCSSPPVDTYINSKQLTIIRNKVNIGGNSNALKAIENANSEWLVILADDDEPNQDFFKIIFDEIEQIEKVEKNIGAVKFLMKGYPDQKSAEVGHLEEFLKYNQPYGQLFSTMFLPSWLFHVPSVQPYLRYGHLWSSFHMPCVMVVIFGLINNSFSVYFSEKETVLWEYQDTSFNESVVFSMMLYSIFVFPYLNSDHEVRLFLRSLIGSTIKQKMIFLIKVSSRMQPLQKKILFSSFASISFKDRLAVWATVLFFNISIIPYFKDKMKHISRGQGVEGRL